MNRDQYQAEASTERLLYRLNRQAILASQRQSLFSYVNRTERHYSTAYYCTECNVYFKQRYQTIGSEILHPGIENAKRAMKTCCEVCPHVQEFADAIAGSKQVLDLHLMPLPFGKP